MTCAYYNDVDPFVCQWLRNLIAAGHIAPGDVDERSIAEVQPDDLRGYTQCHFFAGIGGWSLALRLAGWPDTRPVWTGSCPCQPFSSAAHGRNARRQDDRHLWPVWRNLIAQCRPRVVLGEQVAQAGDWLDEVCDDMEDLDYAIGASISPAVAVGADHARARLYFACHANGNSESGVPVDAEAPRLPRTRGFARSVVSTHGVSARMAQLRAFGNAIHPRHAAEFVAAVMECMPC